MRARLLLLNYFFARNPSPSLGWRAFFMVSSSVGHEKGVAKRGKPPYSSPLAARHSAETKATVVVLKRWRSRCGAGFRPIGSVNRVGVAVVS